MNCLLAYIEHFEQFSIQIIKSITSQQLLSQAKMIQSQGEILNTNSNKNVAGRKRQVHRLSQEKIQLQLKTNLKDSGRAHHNVQHYQYQRREGSVKLKKEHPVIRSQIVKFADEVVEAVAGNDMEREERHDYEAPRKVLLQNKLESARQSSKVKLQRVVGEEARGYTSHRKSERSGKNNAGIVMAAGRRSQVNQLQLKYHSQQERVAAGASATERTGAPHATDRDGAPQNLYSGCKLPGRQHQPQSASQKPLYASAAKLAQNVQLKFQKQKSPDDVKAEVGHLKNFAQIKTQRDQSLNQNAQRQRQGGLQKKEKSKGVHTHRHLANDDQHNLRGSGPGPLKNEWSDQNMDLHRKQPLPETESKGREVMPMQLRTQLKRSLLQPSSNNANAKASEAVEAGLHLAQLAGNTALMMSPPRQGKESQITSQHHYANAHQQAAQPFVSSIGGSRAQSRLSSSRQRQDIVAAQDEQQRGNSNIGNISNLRRSSGRQEQPRGGLSGANFSSSQPNDMVPITDAQQLQNIHDEARTQPQTHKKTSTAGHERQLSSAKGDKKREGNGVATQPQVGQLHQVCLREVWRPNGDGEETGNHHSKEQNSSRARMAALALNSKLQNKNRIRTEPRQQYGPSKNGRIETEDGAMHDSNELRQPLFDSARDQTKAHGKDDALRASTSRAKITKDSQIKIIPVLRDLEVAKSKQTELQALSSTERSQKPPQAETKGVEGLLMQAFGRQFAEEQLPIAGPASSRVHKGSSSAQKQKVLPKPKQKLNLLHGDGQRGAEKQPQPHLQIEQIESEAAVEAGMDAAQATKHSFQDRSKEGKQVRDEAERSHQEPYLLQHPSGKSSTQPMILKVDSRLAGQNHALAAVESHQAQQQQSVERRRLIFQRQKVFNLSSREELGVHSHAGLKHHKDSTEQASKFNHNPLIKCKSKEASVSSIDRGASVTQNNSKSNAHQKPQILSSNLLNQHQNANMSNVAGNSKAKNASQNFYGAAIDPYSSKEDTQLQSHQQMSSRLEPSKQDMNSTIHEIIRKQQEQISKKNLNVKKMPVSKAEIAKAKQGLTEVVVKNPKISCGGGVVQPYAQGSPMRRAAPLTSMRNVNLKATRIDNESNVKRAMDSRRIVEQRGPFPSSQMKPQHDWNQNQAEQQLQNLQVINASSKMKKRQSHHVGDQQDGPCLADGRAGSEDSHLNDLIVSIKKQQQKRQIKLQSQINDAGAATAMTKPNLANARRYDTQAALGPSGVLILNPGQHKDAQLQIPKSSTSAAFHGKASSQREHTDGLTVGKRSSTKPQNQELARLNKLQSHQNLNCISSLQADQTVRAPPARAASNFTQGTHDEVKSIRSLQSVKHYGLQNIPQVANNLANAQNAASTSADRHVNAPSILKAQQPINRFRSQPGSKFLLHEESEQQANPQPKSQLQVPNKQSESATSTGKYQNIQVQLSNQYLKLRSFQQHDSGDMRLLKEEDLAAQHRTSYGFNVQLLPAKQRAVKNAEHPPEQLGLASRSGNTSANPAKSIHRRTARHLPHIQTHGTNIEMRRLQLSNLNQQSSRVDGRNVQQSHQQQQHSERQKQSRSQRSIEQIDTHRLIQEHYSNERKEMEGREEHVRLKDTAANRDGAKRDKKLVQSHDVLRIKKDLVKSHRQPAAADPARAMEGWPPGPPGQRNIQQAGQPPAYSAIQQVQHLQAKAKRNRSNESGNPGRSALAFISSRNLVNLRDEASSGIQTERHPAHGRSGHDNRRYSNRVGEDDGPQELRAAASHVSIKKAALYRAALHNKEDRYAAMERLLIDEKDRILETNENNSRLSSHQQIMKSDDSVRFIKQKAEVNIKKQLQPKQSDRVNGLEKSRSSRNLSHGHGTFGHKEQLSPEDHALGPRKQAPEHRDEAGDQIVDRERKHQAASLSSVKKNSSQRKVNSKFVSLSSSTSAQNALPTRQALVSNKNIQINNFNLNQELKSESKQPRKVQEKQALRKQSPEKHDKEPRLDVKELLKPNRQQISDIPINNSSSQQEMLNFIDYLDDRFHLFSETSKPNSVLRGPASKLEDSVAEIQQIERSASRPELQHVVPQRPLLQQPPMKTERVKGLKLKTELQTPSNINDIRSQKSLAELDFEGQVSPVKVAPSQADIDCPFEEQTELEFLCGLDNSIKFIDQQHSPTPSQLKALALFEQESPAEAFQVRQRHSEGHKAADQPIQSDNQSFSSVQMLLKLQQRGPNTKAGDLQRQPSSEQRPLRLAENASDLEGAEQQQDISPLKLAGDGSPQGDDIQLEPDEVSSPWQRLAGPQRSTSPPLPQGREEGARPEQKQDDVPDVAQPFEPAEASIYSFQ